MTKRIKQLTIILFTSLVLLNGISVAGTTCCINLGETFHIDLEPSISDKSVSNCDDEHLNHDEHQFTEKDYCDLCLDFNFSETELTVISDSQHSKINNFSINITEIEAPFRSFYKDGEYCFSRPIENPLSVNHFLEQRQTILLLI